MTTTTRRRRSKKRFYWAEIGFLLLGLIGLKPEIITAFLPQSRPVTVPTYYDWPSGSQFAHANDAAIDAAIQRANLLNAMHPNGMLMVPNGNEWGNATQFASYHPASTTQAIPASSTSPWSQVTSTKPYGGNQPWSSSNTSPPVAWPDKWGPNGVPVPHAVNLPQYAVPQYNVASLPQPSSASTSTSYYGQTQSSLPSTMWPTTSSPSSATTSTAWNAQTQPVLVPMQQRPPQWPSTNTLPSTVASSMGMANPSMSFTAGGTTPASYTTAPPNPLSYASTPYASTPVATYPYPYPASPYSTYPTTASVAGVNGATVAYPTTRTPTAPYPGTTYPSTAVGAPNAWNQYGVPAGGSLGRY